MQLAVADTAFMAEHAHDYLKHLNDDGQTVYNGLFEYILAQTFNSPLYLSDFERWANLMTVFIGKSYCVCIA